MRPVFRNVGGIILGKKNRVRYSNWYLQLQNFTCTPSFECNLLHYIQFIVMRHYWHDKLYKSCQIVEKGQTPPVSRRGGYNPPRVRITHCPLGFDLLCPLSLLALPGRLLHSVIPCCCLSLFTQSPGSRPVGLISYLGYDFTVKRTACLPQCSYFG